MNRNIFIGSKQYIQDSLFKIVWRLKTYEALWTVFLCHDWTNQISIYHLNETAIKAITFLSLSTVWCMMASVLITFSLTSLQDDKDLVHEFVVAEGLTCLIKVGAEADQNYQNYILRGTSPTEQQKLTPHWFPLSLNLNLQLMLMEDVINQSCNTFLSINLSRTTCVYIHTANWWICLMTSSHSHTKHINTQMCATDNVEIRPSWAAGWFIHPMLTMWLFVLRSARVSGSMFRDTTWPWGSLNSRSLPFNGLLWGGRSHIA